MQVRVFCFTPGSHVVEQGPHLLHFVYPPSTTGLPPTEKKNALETNRYLPPGEGAGAGEEFGEITFFRGPEGESTVANRIFRVDYRKLIL